LGYFWQERLKFFFRRARFGAIAIRFFHLLVMRHRHLHLCVGRFRQEREEHDEVFVRGNGLRQVR